jgi:hypothetical protein
MVQLLLELQLLLVLPEVPMVQLLLVHLLVQ